MVCNSAAGSSWFLLHCDTVGSALGKSVRPVDEPRDKLSGCSSRPGRTFHPIPQESGGGWRKDEASEWFSQVGVNASKFCQCFDTVGSVRGRASTRYKPVALAPKVIFQKKRRRKRKGDRLTHLHLENGHYERWWWGTLGNPDECGNWPL